MSKYTWIASHYFNCRDKEVIFLTKLCSLHGKFLTKKLFLVRLYSYFIDTERKHYGFIQEIMDILYKYYLHEYVIIFMRDGVFPTKQSWKIIVNNTVDKVQSDEWTRRIQSDNNFSRFRNIHLSVKVPDFWKCARSSREIINAYFITKLLTDIPNNTGSTCELCDRPFLDVYVHACCSCCGTQSIRDAWWDFIIERFPLQLFVELYSYDDEHLYCILLGKHITTVNIDTDSFLSLCHVHVALCVAEYSRVTRRMIQ